MLCVVLLLICLFFIAKKIDAEGPMSGFYAWSEKGCYTHVETSDELCSPTLSKNWYDAEKSTFGDLEEALKEARR